MVRGYPYNLPNSTYLKKGTFGEIIQIVVAYSALVSPEPWHSV